MAFIGIAVAWVAGLGLAGRHSVHPLLFDSRADRFLARSSGLVYHVAKQLSHVGEPRVFVTITSLTALALILVGDYRAAATAVVSVALTHLLVEHVLKPFFDRRLSHLSDPSFPSGHAAVALALAGAVILAAGPDRPMARLIGPVWRGLLVAIVFIVACSVGLAMVVLQFHRLSDVLAGIPLGLSVTACTALILDALIARWQPSPANDHAAKSEPESVTR
jgi:undecaprenyl-diphosphatase